MGQKIRTLILALFLMISGMLQAQTYQADSLFYYSNLYNDKPDTAIGEEILIVFNKGNINISKHNAVFVARITDTVGEKWITPKTIARNFYIKVTPTSYKGNDYTMEMIVYYADNQPYLIALIHNLQLFIYHIVHELTPTYSKNERKIQL